MPKRVRNRSARIKFPIFANFEVRVILARDIVKTGHNLGVDLKKTTAAWIHPTPEKPNRGWLVFKLEPDEATVAHEASHAIRTMLAFVGAKNDSETFAYHLDYLVGRIHKFLKRK